MTGLPPGVNPLLSGLFAPPKPRDSDGPEAEKSVLVRFGCHRRLVRPCRHWQRAAGGTDLANYFSTEKSCIAMSASRCYA